jgi:hypothetical protein
MGIEKIENSTAFVNIVVNIAVLEVLFCSSDGFSASVQVVGVGRQFDIVSFCSGVVVAVCWQQLCFCFGAVQECSLSS